MVEGLTAKKPAPKKPRPVKKISSTNGDTPEIEVIRHPRPQVDDRVQRIGCQQAGVVLEVADINDETVVKVHWGTSDSKMITDWVPLAELEPSPYVTVSPDTVIKRLKMGASQEGSSSA